MSKDLYEVYVAYDKQGNPLYVGQGAKVDISIVRAVNHTINF